MELNRWTRQETQGKVKRVRGPMKEYCMFVRIFGRELRFRRYRDKKEKKV